MGDFDFRIDRARGFTSEERVASGSVLVLGPGFSLGAVLDRAGHFVGLLLGIAAIASAAINGRGERVSGGR